MDANENKVVIVAGVPCYQPLARRGMIYVPGPNYEKLPCQECGKLAWFGPRQLALMEDGARALCMVCACIATEGKAETRNLGGESGTIHKPREQ